MYAGREERTAEVDGVKFIRSMVIARRLGRNRRYPRRCGCKRCGMESIFGRGIVGLLIVLLIVLDH